MDWRNQLQQPLSEQQLTDVILKALDEQPTVARVRVLAPMQLELTFATGKPEQLSVSLHTLWNALLLNDGMPVVWLVQRFLRYWLGLENADFSVSAKDSHNLLPGMLNTDSLGAEHERQMVTVPLAGDVCLAYQIDKGHHRVYLNREHLPKLPFPESYLKRLAFNNLASHYGDKPTWHDHGEGVLAFGMADTDYGSTLLANDQVWEAVRRARGIDRLMAAVPCHCHVFFTDADSAPGVQRLRKKVEEAFFSETETPLSRTLFVRDAGPWRTQEQRSNLISVR